MCLFFGNRGNTNLQIKERKHCKHIYYKGDMRTSFKKERRKTFNALCKNLFDSSQAVSKEKITSLVFLDQRAPHPDPPW